MIFVQERDANDTGGNDDNEGVYLGAHRFSLIFVAICWFITGIIDDDDDDDDDIVYSEWVARIVCEETEYLF